MQRYDKDDTSIDVRFDFKMMWGWKEGRSNFPLLEPPVSNMQRFKMADFKRVREQACWYWVTSYGGAMWSREAEFSLPAHFVHFPSPDVYVSCYLAVGCRMASAAKIVSFELSPR